MFCYFSFSFFSFFFFLLFLFLIDYPSLILYLFLLSQFFSVILIINIIKMEEHLKKWFQVRNFRYRHFHRLVFAFWNEFCHTNVFWPLRFHYNSNRAWMSNVCDIHVNKFRTSVSLSSRHNFNKFKLILVRIFYVIHIMACLTLNRSFVSLMKYRYQIKIVFFLFKNKLLFKDICVFKSIAWPVNRQWTGFLQNGK